MRSFDGLGRFDQIPPGAVQLQGSVARRAAVAARASERAPKRKDSDGARRNGFARRLSDVRRAASARGLAGRARRRTRHRGLHRMTIEDAIKAFDQVKLDKRSATDRRIDLAGDSRIACVFSKRWVWVI